MRRIWAVVGAVVLAVLGTIVLIGYVRGAENRALEGEELVTVLVVDRQVPRGTASEAIGIAVREEQVPAKVRAEGSVASIDLLSGLVTSVDLVPGEQLLASRFLTPESLVVSTRVDVPPDLLQVTITLDPGRAVGGQLAPGDAVAVVASFEQFNYDAVEPDKMIEIFGDIDLDLVITEIGVFHVGAASEDDPLTLTDESALSSALRPVSVRTSDSTHVIAHKILVVNVQVEERPVDVLEGGAGHDLAPTGNLLITLAADVETVERIVFAAEHGSLWLAAERPEAPEPVTPVRTRGNIYR